MFERKSNIIYLAFTGIVVFVLALFIITKVAKSEEKKYSVDYEKTLALGNYVVKVTNATYVKDTKELYFYLSMKLNNDTDHNSSVPEISKLSIRYRDKKGDERKQDRLEKHDKNKVNEMTNKVSMADVESDYLYVYLELKSIRDEYKDDDTKDEFGNIVDGETHKKEEFTQYIVFDLNDIKVIDSSENKQKVETSVSFEKPKETDAGKEKANTFTEKVTEDVADSSSEKEEKTTANTTTATAEATTARSTNMAQNGGENGTTRATRAGGGAVSSANNTQNTAKKTTAATTKTTKSTTKATTKSTTKATTKSTTKSTSAAANKLIELRTEPNVPFSLKVGQTAKIKAVYTPASIKVNLKWQSFDTLKITVSQDGTIKAVGAGSTIIKVTDTLSGSTASVMVTVK